LTALFSRAVNLVGECHFAEAAPLLTQICGADGATPEAWLMLGLCFLSLGRFAQLLGLIDIRHGRAGDGLKLFNDCLLMALQRSDYANIHGVAAAVPPTSALSVVSRYVDGLADAQTGHVDEGIGKIIAAGNITRALPSDLANAPYVETICVEGNLLASFETIELIERIPVETLLATLQTVQAKFSLDRQPSVENAVEERFVFLSSCDERYLDRFGQAVVTALDETGAKTTYHLHIVDPTPDLAEKMEALQASCSSLALHYSTEVYGGNDEGYTRAEYYACSRLVRLPEVMALYNRDVFMWDVDTDHVENLRALTNAMKGFDLGYFHMENTRLTLASHLATVYFSNTEATRRCARIIRNYVLAKLPTTPYWLLDQAAVYCTSEYLAATTKEFRIQDFGRSLGRAFNDCIAVASSATEKQTMRAQAGK
jgi:hypothetical protein